MVSRTVKPDDIHIRHQLRLPQDAHVLVQMHRGSASGPVHEALEVSWPTKFESLEISTVNGISECPHSLQGLPYSKRDLLRHVRGLTVGMTARAKPPIAVDGYFIDLRALSPNNLSHLLHDFIPLVLHAQKVLKADVILVLRQIAPAFLSVVQAFGIRVLDTELRVSGKLVRAHACRRLTAYEPPWFDMPALVFVPHVYQGSKFESPLQADSLFVARRGDRALGNHAEVEAMLSAQGFKTVYMEDYSAAQKMGLMAQARRIVGIHGAGMAPAVFSSQLELVVELMPPHAFNEWFILSIGPMAKRYAVVMADYDARLTRAGWPTLLHFKSAAFSIDLDLLRAALTA